MILEGPQQTALEDAPKIWRKHGTYWTSQGELEAAYLDEWASLMAQMVENPPAMQETWVRSMCQEDLLEEEMASHSSVLAWRIPWTEEPGRLQSMGLQRVGPKRATNAIWIISPGLLLLFMSLTHSHGRQQIQPQPSPGNEQGFLSRE